MVLQQQKNKFAETLVEGCYTYRLREKSKEAAVYFFFECGQTD
jgi:hypothetical protein